MEASFSPENLICRMFAPNPAATKMPRDARDDYIRELGKITRGHFGQKGGGFEAIPLRPLPDDLSPVTRSNLFHERVHYWQMLSTSMLQYRFVLLLDAIGLGVRTLGGDHRLVCGQTQFAADTSLEVVRTSIASMNANFQKTDVTPDMIRMPNIVSRSPFTDMPFCHLPHPQAGQALPGYAAGLGFGEHTRAYLIPLGGYNLMESSAHISTLLCFSEEVPRAVEFDSAESRMYLGPWEFWARLHQDRHESQEELVLSYLAAADYTLNPDLLDIPGGDPESIYEMTSIPYRFGKLASRMRDAPPLRLRGRTAAVAVSEYQQIAAERCGWPTMEASTRKMVAFLTKCFVASFAFRMRDDSETRELVRRLFRTPLAELGGDLQTLESAWELTKQLVASQYESGEGYVWPLGRSAIGTMLNASVARLREPGTFALPHLHQETHRRRFPLPMIRVNGDYCDDGSWGEGLDDLPYSGGVLALRFDCIGIATLSPLQDAEARCGLEMKYDGCHCTAEGEECPSWGVRAGAASSGLCGTYCHWVNRALDLGTAPAAVKERWKR